MTEEQGKGWEIGKARNYKRRQREARQGKARQGKARQGKARQDKARQGKARPKTRQDKTRQDKTKTGPNQRRDRFAGTSMPSNTTRHLYHPEVATQNTSTNLDYPEQRAEEVDGKVVGQRRPADDHQQAPFTKQKQKQNKNSNKNRRGNETALSTKCMPVLRS